jgi:hypothetical protein
MTNKPRLNSESEKELNKVEAQFKAYDEQVQSLTVDRMNQAPKLDVEPQTKLSQNQIAEAKDIYLKPKRSIPSKEKFNEDFRKDYEFQKEYVYFIAENKEIIGEEMTSWTKPFAGMPAEEWVVPANKPVWGPRYLAERIKGCCYHVLSMNEQRSAGSDQMGSYYGQIVVDNTVQRLDATPATKRKSIFMGAVNF